MENGKAVYGGKGYAPTRNVYKEQGSATPGNARQKMPTSSVVMTDHKGRVMQTSLHVIANAARRDKSKRFCSLYSLFNRVVLGEAFRKLNRKSVSGVDSVTWKDYEENLEANLIDLEERLKQKRYWPRFLKRMFLPKPNGKKRPIGIPALEDKIVQQVAADILNALFEPLFLDCSYAYRPDRSAKQAVADLRHEIRYMYTWVVEADIKSFKTASTMKSCWKWSRGVLMTVLLSDFCGVFSKRGY